MNFQMWELILAHPVEVGGCHIKCVMSDMLIEKFFVGLNSLEEHSQPCILSLLFANKMTSSASHTKQ